MLLESQTIVVYRVGELPGSTERLDVRTEGRVVAESFRNNPHLPGIILCDGDRVTAGLSQQEFLRHMSRPFGMEVYLPRPIGVLVEHARLETLQIDAGLTIEKAVEKCLARPSERLYDPVLVVNSEDNGGARLLDCQTLFLALSGTASLRATQMGRILQAVPIGLMLFEKDGKISPEHSEALSSIFEQESLSDQSVYDVLGKLLPPATLKRFSDYMGVLFNARLIDRLIKGINPIADVAVEFPPANGSGRRKKHLSFAFERVRIGGEISFILAMIEDRTRRVLMDEEIRLREDSAERRLKLVVQMMALDEKELNAFLGNLEDLCEKGEALADAARMGDPASRELALDLFRKAHALKGEAGMLCLEGFRDQIHEFEEPLRCALQDRRDFQIEAPGVEKATHRLRDHLAQAREGISMLHRISRERRGGGAAPSSDDKAEAGQESALQGMFRATERLVGELSVRYAKQARFVTHTTQDLIPAAHHGVLRQALQQLVRNSVVHGVEHPAERVACGKASVASIQFAARPRDAFIEYVVQDDGRGVNAAKLAERASLDPSTPRHELAQLVFQPGMSTAIEDGLDAGRGIGLDMVRDLIEKAGGTIALHDKPGEFCAVQFLLPRNPNPT